MANQKNCFLCLRNCTKARMLSESTVGDESLIEIVKLHFSFQIKFKYEMNEHPLCNGCFLKIRNFHEFYLEIRTIHGNVLEVDVKKEWDVLIDGDPPSDRESIKIESLNPITTITEGVNSESIPEEDPVDDEDGNKRIGKIRKRSDNSKVASQIKGASKFGVGSDYHDKLLRTFSMKCDLCETNFNDWDEARDHYKAKHNKYGYLTCCGRKFLAHGRIIDHIIWHENPDSYKCTICDKTFLDGTRLRKHKNDLHSEDDRIVFKCDQCPREYRRRNSLNHHLKTMHPKKKREYVCYKCGQNFREICSVRTHFKIVHDQSDSRICDVCAKFFKSSKAYELHYKLVHTNELPKVQCPVCQKWVKHEYLLRDHMRIHKPQQPQMCKYCGKESPHIRALRHHIKRNHMNISFACHICNKTFKNPKTLKEHIAIHTGDKALYTCSFCPKAFRSSANMYAHRKRDHPIEYQNSVLLGINYKNNADDIVNRDRE